MNIIKAIIISFYEVLKNSYNYAKTLNKLEDQVKSNKPKHCKLKGVIDCVGFTQIGFCDGSINGIICGSFVQEK